ncbi:MAG: hypothetical protein LBU73_06645 [Helicobacteraceae bacterium]|jgi:hypothetical protein|nr:hypothetical protein [Helicobacteraceae bacterium]
MRLITRIKAEYLPHKEKIERALMMFFPSGWERYITSGVPKSGGDLKVAAFRLSDYSAEILELMQDGGKNTKQDVINAAFDYAAEKGEFRC